MPVFGPRREKVDISICVCSNRPRWFGWMEFQIRKQVRYLENRGFEVEVIICIPTKFKGKYNPAGFRVLHVSEENDIGTLRNTCCNEAHGQFVAIMDDDDWYPEYRIHKQWQMMFRQQSHPLTLKGKHPKVKVATVNIMLCYDIKANKCYWYKGSSESCIFFDRTHMTEDKRCWGEGNGEGGKFTEGSHVMIEDQIELIIAMRHPDNNFDRTYTDEETDGLPEHGFPPSVNLEPFELDFLKNVYK